MTTVHQCTYQALLVVAFAIAATTAVYAKGQRVLHTEAEVAQMRENIETYQWARDQVAATVAGAEPWMKYSDQELWDLFPSTAVPRAVNINAEQGCPVHGREIFEGRGHYPWH